MRTHATNRHSEASGMPPVNGFQYLQNHFLSVLAIELRRIPTIHQLWEGLRLKGSDRGPKGKNRKEKQKEMKNEVEAVGLAS